MSTRRTVLATAFALGAPAAASAQAFAAEVSASYTGTDGARVGGVAHFHTLGAALAAAPEHASSPWRIHLLAGRYREKSSVDKPFVTIVGDGREATVLTWDAASDTRGPDGRPLGTRGSFTLRVTAPDFRAERLTIENAFDFDANARKPESDSTKFHNTQGVALATTDGSDRASFEDVSLLGHQDTFFANAGRQYFHHCVIAGNVDFIFGAGQAVFDDCDIVSLERGSGTDNGYIAAPSTDIAAPFGFLFVNSRLKKARPEMAAGSVSLGRPWHPSATPRANGSAVFMDCWMGDHISATGWVHMSSVDSMTKVRYWFEPGSARLLEYRSTGPGAVASPTRRVMSDGDARSYTIAGVLGDWTPEGHR